jgi:hypothetical protein
MMVVVLTESALDIIDCKAGGECHRSHVDSF